ncbi:MAG: phage portal protein, partial [Oscillospiraceae bacterium]
KKLRNYYCGEHKISSYFKKDGNVPNNKIVYGMPKYITTIATGYFLGNPITYSSKDTVLLGILQQDFNYNDEQDHNYELAKMCSIFGHAYEFLYIDEDNHRRFMAVSPEDATIIYDDTRKNLLAAIWTRQHTDIKGNVSYAIEYCNKNQIWRMEKLNGGSFTITTAIDHIWGDVPVVEYINNEERLGDFESVLSLVDAYDKVQSNTANLFQQNDEALLLVSKMGDVGTTDIKEMKEKGAVILDDGGDIKWLLKEINDTAIENYKNRLQEDMHVIAQVPHLCDTEFAGNSSGVAMEYKLWGLDQLFSIKARKFKKSLQRRIELFTNIINYSLDVGKHDYTAIDMNFRQNKPQNIVELADVVTKLEGEVSKETRLAWLPFIDDVKKELGRIDKENNAVTMENYSSLSSNQTALNGEAKNE